VAKKTQTYYTVEEFCNNVNWSEATKKNYKYALLNYARFLFPDLDSNRHHPEAALAALNKRVRYKADPAKDISAYANFMKGKPPKTIGLYLTAVRSFYGLNGHVFNKQELKRIIPKTGDAETKQGDLTTEILRKMVGAADIRGRVLIMLLASTACRIGELCDVTLDDVDMNRNPPSIYLKKEYTKNGRARTVFMTDECREAVLIWLGGERMKYLTASYERNEGLNDKFRDKNRLPPKEDRRLLGISTYGARNIWYNTLSRVMDKDKLKPDEKTHIHPLTPHVVRKWWRVTANQGFRNEDIAHLIMGHWNNALDFVYAKMGDDGIGKEFLKAQSALSLLTSESTKELHQNIGRQADKLLSLERENNALKIQIKSTETLIEAMERRQRILAEKVDKREDKAHLIADGLKDLSDDQIHRLLTAIGKIKPDSSPAYGPAPWEED
jgi:integrase